MTRPTDPPDSHRVDPHLEVRERRRGRRPGDAYVRIFRPFEDTFRRDETGGLVATERTVLQRTGWHGGLREAADLAHRHADQQ